MTEKLSDERAIEILKNEGAPPSSAWVVRLAMDAGAAAIAAQKELVDALAKWVRVYMTDYAGREIEKPLADHACMAIDLLVRFGRVTKDGDSYRWSKP